VSALAVQARTELALSLRQGEQLLVSLVIPLLILVFFSLVDVLPLPEAVEEPVDFLTPGVLALAVMSSAMVSLGIGTAFERQYKVLKRLGATPLGRPRLIGAKILMILTLEVVQVTVLVSAAVVLGWRPAGEDVVLALPAVVLGTAAFAGLGLLMAGTLRGTLTLAVANGLYLVLLLLGGMVIPLDRLPDGLRMVAELLPAAALAETLGGALGGTTAGARAWVVLAGWAVAAPIAAAALFRWE
jgi:ABC-2 type transport system permease protein